MKYIPAFLLLFLFSPSRLLAQSVVSLGNDRVICEGTQITLTASEGAIFYQWSTGQTGPIIVVSPADTTDYHIQATFANGMQAYDTITVYVLPQPEFSLGSDTSICMHDSITLLVYGGYNYLWSDNSTSNSITVSPGSSSQYWLLMTDFYHCQGYDTINVTVNPLPTLTISPTQEICIGCTATLYAVSGGASYFWNTGETTSSVHVSPFIESNYVVTVTDQNGCKNTDTTLVIVNSLPMADFTYTNVCQYDTAFFHDLSTDTANSITQRQWVYNGSIFSTNSNSSMIFTTPGNHDVSLVIKNNKNCTDTITKTIVIYPKPVADFSLPLNNTCTNPITITADNLSVNSVGWFWDFGNGQTGSDENPDITYLAPGSYEIELVAVSEFGCADTIIRTFSLYQKPLADFSSDITSGCEPLNVEFYNNSQYYDSSKWYIDNHIMIAQDTNYSFWGEGFYDITLMVYNEHCSDIITKQDYIEVLNKPVPDFNWHEDNDPVPHGMTYFENYTLDANHYQWLFGDSTNSFVFEPGHRYDVNGRYTVTLIAYDTLSGCSDTLMKHVDVTFFNGLFIPNAFSPTSTNPDLKNFFPLGVGLETYHIWVYDTWGNLLWQSTALDDAGRPSEFWDGTVSSNMEQTDTFVWKASATFKNGTIWQGMDYGNGKLLKYGTVTIIK